MKRTLAVILSAAMLFLMVAPYSAAQNEVPDEIPAEISAAPEGTVGPLPPPGAAAYTDGSAPQDDQEAGKISLDLKGMDIIEVIKMLAAKGSLNVILGADVKGKVTIFLKSVYLMDAFEIILVANNLAYDKRGDIIYVMSQRDYERMYGEKYAEKKEIALIQLKYAKAAEVGKALTQMKSKVGKIVVDEGSNTVIIMDNPNIVAHIKEAVQNIDIPTMTKIFELKYAKAADMKERIAENLTKGIGTVQVDERTNKIAVTDIEKKIDDIRRIVVAFDEKPQQVLIEAKILEVTLDDHLQLGVQWDSVLKIISREIKLKNAFQLAAAGTFGPPGTELLVGMLGKTDTDVVVQVLKTVGDTNLLSSPRITALNNQEAKILVGSSQPYATNTVTQSTGTATTGTNISFLDIGVKLFVTPSINKDGFVTMKIRPEVSSSNTNYTYGTPPTTIPIVQTTQAETSISVKDGTTIVIGGLVKDLRTKTVHKVPILGDIPIVKYAFSDTNEQVTKQELVIFLTPHIISGESEYLETPVTPPLGENKFTVPESTTFERRAGVPVKPTIYKEKRPQDDGEYVAPHVDSSAEIQSPDAMPQEYYIGVKNRIISYIAIPNDPKYKKAKGKVKTAFFLTPQGRISRGPDILESSNHDLDAIAIKAVVRASPYPKFPKSMTGGEKRFVIDLAFE